jgi:hypothetical protein
LEGNLPIPVPVLHLGGRFFSNPKPMGNTDLTRITVLDITDEFPSIPNPQHELHRNPYLNPTVAETGVT